jgi:hypothetical protein
LRPERGGAGTGQENYVYNNIFANCGKAGIVFLDPHNEADGNIYVSMPSGFLGFMTADSQQWLDLPAWRESHGWDKNGMASDMKLDFDPDRLELTMSGQGTLPNLKLFNHIDSDILGKPTGESRVPGPFVDPGASPTRKVDPRVPAPTGMPSTRG